VNLQGSALLFEDNLAYMNLFTKKQLRKGSKRNIGGNLDFSSPEMIEHEDWGLGNPFSTGFYRCF